MSRPTPNVVVPILLFLAFLTIFASAAPTIVARELDYTPTNSTNTTNSTDTTGNISNGVYTASSEDGRATWYDAGLGACGGYNTDQDLIVAIPEAEWDNGSHCNRQVRITNLANGKTCTATVRDMCPGCSPGDLDMSPATFQSLDPNLGDGVFQISWYYL